MAVTGADCASERGSLSDLLTYFPYGVLHVSAGQTARPIATVCTPSAVDARSTM